MVEADELTPSGVRNDELIPPEARNDKLIPPEVRGDELTPPGVRNDELIPPGVRHGPRLAGAPVFDPGEFLGLDPWPPRRALNVLQRARVATGLSQDELAAEVGVCRQTVSSIENRRRVPSVQLAIAIAAALHRTVEELFPAGELSG